jgi:uncharacterized damage-inducible protein DinB/uncharacterized protein YciI
MKKVCLLMVVALHSGVAGQYLLSYQLAPGVDPAHLAPAQAAALKVHGEYLQALQKKGMLLTAARVADPVHPSAVAIVNGDEASAKAAAAQDPAAKAGLVNITVQPIDFFTQTPPAALVSDTKLNYEMAARYLMGAAQKMPETDYNFRPADSVRTFAQLVAHIAEAQYIACMPVRGEEYKARNLEQTLSSKAELIPALEKAIGYCQETWTGLSSAALADPVKLFGRERTKLGVMDIATAHAFEHYGNMVTYLRMKGVTPPSSETPVTLPKPE